MAGLWSGGWRLRAVEAGRDLAPVRVLAGREHRVGQHQPAAPPPNTAIIRLHRPPARAAITQRAGATRRRFRGCGRCGGGDRPEAAGVAGDDLALNMFCQ